MCSVLEYGPFHVSFSHLHYNVIQRACQAIASNTAPNLLPIHAALYGNYSPILSGQARVQ